MSTQINFSQNEHSTKKIPSEPGVTIRKKTALEEKPPRFGPVAALHSRLPHKNS
jgi:hypothetical protein